MSEAVSLVKALKEFFESDPHGRKVEIAEIKALTPADREEMRQMLISEGFNVNELPKAA